jgi:hypothetical protein
MLAKELEAFIKEGVIDRMTIDRTDGASAWSICAYGENLPAHVVNHLALNEQGSKRLWSDLIAAYTFIRKSGFTRMIEVDG